MAESYFAHMSETIKRSEFHQIIDHPGSGALLGIQEGRLLLVEENRAGLPFSTFEIPGGVCERNETHEQAARREFLEETGYEVGYTFHAFTFNPSVGYSNEMISIFYAEVGEKRSTAERETIWVSRKEAQALIDSGRITDAQTLTALSFWLLKDLDFRTPSVIFLCTGNYYRSRFAENYFNHLTKDSEIARADSKGLLAWRKINEGMISPFTLDFLAQESIPTGKLKFPEQVEERHFLSGATIIAMDESEHRKMMEKDFSDFADKIEYWQVHDIDFTEPQEALPVLKTQVEALVESL